MENKTNRIIVILIFILICGSIAVSVIVSDKNKLLKKSLVDIELKTNLLNDSLNNIIKGLELTNKTQKDELTILKFKIERIKYYNDVAEKDNNIIFLRGWINRVLKDEK